MRWLVDIFKEYLHSAVLREERDKAKAEAESFRKKAEELERRLDANHSDLSHETCRVLIYLFQSDEDDCETDLMTDELQMEQGMIKYHLDLLQERGSSSMYRW